MKSAAEKMRVPSGARVHLARAPDDVVAGLGLPREVRFDQDLSGPVDVVLLFVITADRLGPELTRLEPALAPGGALWTAWPKGRGLGSDLTIREVIRIAYDCGFVESTTISLDLVWSAIKLTRPVPGRQYHNSYGTLPER